MLQLGSLSLIPYEREQAPGAMHGVSQEIIDAVLGTYGDVALTPLPIAFTSIRKATLLTWADDANSLDLPENQIFDRLEQARYIAFSALAQRRFCSHVGYCNADGYEVIAQRFDAERPGSISITTRRRDGFFQTYISRTSSPRFIRPEHVDSRLHIEIDEVLARGLLELPLGELKSQIDEAIAIFLRANTDVSRDAPHAELVLMRSAFEALLDASVSSIRPSHISRGLTIHSSRTRFAGRLNSGVRPRWEEFQLVILLRTVRASFQGRFVQHCVGHVPQRSSSVCSLPCSRTLGASVTGARFGAVASSDSSWCSVPAKGSGRSGVEGLFAHQLRQSRPNNSFKPSPLAVSADSFKPNPLRVGLIQALSVCGTRSGRVVGNSYSQVCVQADCPGSRKRARKALRTQHRKLACDLILRAFLGSCVR